jgi:hypothetical protein
MKDIDDMGAPLIDERRDRSRIDVIEAAANQGEAFRGEIDHRGDTSTRPLNPRLDRVLIARLHVDEATALQRAQMRGYQLGITV